MRVLEEPSGRPPGHRTVGIGGYLRDAFPEWLGSARLFSHALLRRPPRPFHGPFRAVRGDRGARSRRGSRDRVDPRTARENRHHYRLLRGRPVHRRPRIRGSLQAGPQPRSSADDPQDHGERRGQPHLDGVRHYGPQFHHLDGLLFVGARYRPGGLDDTLRHGGSGVDRRQRSALQLRHPEGLGSHAGGFAGHLPAVLPRPSRHDPGGRRGHAGAGALGSRAGARRANSRPTDRESAVAGQGGDLGDWTSDVCASDLFSRDRHGMILGEGAGMLVLEPWEAAQARGARIHAELVGFGMSADACHITQPSAEGAARAMRGALRDATIQPEQIGYINAHGTATAANDPTETAAIRSVFGAHANKLAISSTKSMHGHALGAAAALEAVAAILALRDGMLPPTANYRMLDAECDLDVIPNRARAAQVEYALSNSFAFGGLNAVLAFKKA